MIYSKNHPSLDLGLVHSTRLLLLAASRRGAPASLGARCSGGGRRLLLLLLGDESLQVPLYVYMQTVHQTTLWAGVLKVTVCVSGANVLFGTSKIAFLSIHRKLLIPTVSLRKTPLRANHESEPKAYMISLTSEYSKCPLKTWHRRTAYARSFPKLIALRISTRAGLMLGYLPRVPWKTWSVSSGNDECQQS